MEKYKLIEPLITTKPSTCSKTRCDSPPLINTIT